VHCGWAPGGKGGASVPARGSVPLSSWRQWATKWFSVGRGVSGRRIVAVASGLAQADLQLHAEEHGLIRAYSLRAAEGRSQRSAVRGQSHRASGKLQIALLTHRTFNSPASATLWRLFAG
jgi:hypothetical protein